MPAFLQAILRPDTPVRLRLWAFAVVTTAVLLLAATSLIMSRVQSRVDVIGNAAAPQAANASDLYFALSDLDAQVARMVLIGDADALSGSKIDALGTYRERSMQVDQALQRSLTTATGDADRAVVLDLLNHLAVYRQWVWQALTAQTRAPADTLGYFTQATNVLHLDLLPAAEQLRDGSEARLDSAYADKGSTEAWGVALAVLLGAALVVLLIGLQVWLARRFRRVFNPALSFATLLVVALVAGVVTILGAQSQRLGAARDDSLDPFLALSQARATSYDAAADTSRYLISANLAYYRQDFTRKSDSLTGGEAPGLASAPEALPRWLAYRKDHERIVGLAEAGRTEEAVGVLTGIRRGDAAFDFSYFDAAVDEIAIARKQAFEVSLRDTERLLRGWTLIPLVVLGLVILLVPLGVRRRLAEYR